jgi:hypothetical protein
VGKAWFYQEFRDKFGIKIKLGVGPVYLIVYSLNLEKVKKFQLKIIVVSIE